LVVPLNISYQTLKDRIDAKLQRSTNLTLGTGSGGPGVPPASKDNVVKLKYLDEEDYVTIQTDEDVLEAFETWREQRGGDLGGDGMGGMGEIELFCQR
jgi:cell division control protein 24